MTDPTLPVPEPEPAAPRRKFSKKWIVVPLVVVLLALAVGGAAYGVHAKGDAKAKEYSKALDAWSEKENDLVFTVASASSGLWDFDDATTKKSLATQKVACNRVLTLRKSAAEDAAAVPMAPDSFFKILSADERKVLKDSAARGKAVKAYAKAVNVVMVQLRKDCVWNIKSNSSKEGDSGAKKIFDQAKELLLKPGHTAGNYYCPSSSKVSCLPATVAQRTQYATLILKALKVDKTYIMKKFFAAGSCDSTSYAELCTALKADLASYYANVGDYSAVFKSIDPSNTKLKQEFEQMKKGNKAADKSFKKALFKAHPDFKSDFRVSKYPFWPEAYFDASAGNLIASLEKLKKAVLHLSGSSGDSVDALDELAYTLNAG
ncbi:MAG: hypothetical protein JWR83_1860 [Aeromicrobium sp.]|nr:hypothetical protein [Aeromicrobium sp.]